MSSMTLDEGMYSICSATWNKEKNSFVAANTTDITKCCIDLCSNTHKTCDNVCDRIYKNNPEQRHLCRQRCRLNYRSCIDTCELYNATQTKTHPYNTCAKQLGCFQNEVYNESCLQENKDRLFECCKKYCIPSKTVDCDDHCAYAPTILKLDEESEKIKHYNISLSDIKNNTNYNYFIIPVIIFVIIIIIIFFYMLKK